MIWSKTKKSIEGLLADALKNRVRFNITRYGPGVSEIQNRAWITFDGNEIFSCSTSGWIRENRKITGEYSWVTDEQTEKELAKRGYFFRKTFEAALNEYLEMPIEAAIQSSNVIIRSISMFDRRLGKRRLQSMHFSEDENPLVITFYDIRCKVEGIETDSKFIRRI
jgi:hypothetical protein